MKIKSIDELEKIGRSHLNKIILREHVEKKQGEDHLEANESQNKEIKYNIMICGGTGCLSSESTKVKKNFELILKAGPTKASNPLPIPDNIPQV